VQLEFHHVHDWRLEPAAVGLRLAGAKGLPIGSLNTRLLSQGRKVRSTVCGFHTVAEPRQP
jgi:hypothetical protein